MGPDVWRPELVGSATTLDAAKAIAQANGGGSAAQ
jgi:hypothetical protein